MTSANRTDPRRHLAPITTAQRHHLNAWARLADRVSADDAPTSVLIDHAMDAYRAAVATTRPHPQLAADGHTDCTWYAQQLACGWKVGAR